MSRQTINIDLTGCFIAPLLILAMASPVAPPLVVLFLWAVQVITENIVWWVLGSIVLSVLFGIIVNQIMEEL